MTPLGKMYVLFGLLAAKLVVKSSGHFWQAVIRHKYMKKKMNGIHNKRDETERNILGSK